ncbi:MAG: alpha/beta hydrolase [Anaerolineae bacterium]
MSDSVAADNVTVNEQMVEVLSIGWKAMPEMVGADWEKVKKALLADMAKMEEHADPNHDQMVHMISDHLQPYPEALAYLNDIAKQVMGHKLTEFEVVEPAAEAAASEPEPDFIDDEDFVDDSVDEGSRGFEESGEFELEEIEVESAEPEENFYRVPVYFATNRKRDKRYKDFRSFTGNRSDEMKYGLAQVSMPKTHVPGNLETPRRWRREKADPNRHILVLSVDLMDKNKFVVSANDTLADAESDSALIYIHGYNVSFGGALRLTAQIATDLEFKGIPITYSWPSMAKTLRYNADEANIAHGQDYFDAFLEMVIKELKVSKVHILAHSMGNRLATLGMRNLPEQVAKGKIGQVLFASPDVDRGVFTQRAAKFAGKADRYTLYINESDLALELSQLIHGFARAGERDNNPLVVDDVDTIDATNIDGSFLGHSFYQRDRTVLGDIVALISQNLAPISRMNLLQKGVEKIYWELTR